MACISLAETVPRRTRVRKPQTSSQVCSEHPPGRGMTVMPRERCLDEAAPDAGLIKAGATRSVPTLRYPSWFHRVGNSDPGSLTPLRGVLQASIRNYLQLDYLRFCQTDACPLLWLSVWQVSVADRQPGAQYGQGNPCARPRNTKKAMPGIGVGQTGAVDLQDTRHGQAQPERQAAAVLRGDTVANERGRTSHPARQSQGATHRGAERA
jgi:hypothetical protein